MEKDKKMKGTEITQTMDMDLSYKMRKLNDGIENLTDQIKRLKPLARDVEGVLCSKSYAKSFRTILATGKTELEVELANFQLDLESANAALDRARKCFSQFRGCDKKTVDIKYERPQERVGEAKLLYSEGYRLWESLVGLSDEIERVVDEPISEETRAQAKLVIRVFKETFKAFNDKGFYIESLEK